MLPVATFSLFPLESPRKKKKETMSVTMKEIGRVLGVNESRVSQLHTKAMLRLRIKLHKLNGNNRIQALQAMRVQQMKKAPQKTKPRGFVYLLRIQITEIEKKISCDEQETIAIKCALANCQKLFI